MEQQTTNQHSTLKVKKVTGRWTRTEHDRFIKALEKFGRDWIAVQKFVKTRSLSQVRSHAQKFFMKMTAEDVEAMIAGEVDSDFQSLSYEHETAYHQKYRDTKKRIKQPNQEDNFSRQKPLQSAKNQDLLSIFKMAIDRQILELSNESLEKHEMTYSPNKTYCSQGQLNQQLSECIKDTGKTQTDLQEKHEDTKQMEFILPDFSQVFNSISELAH